MGSSEADCVELKVSRCQGSHECQAMAGMDSARMQRLVRCHTKLCPVEAGAVKLPAKTCLNAYQNFTVKATGKDSGRIPPGTFLWSRAGARLCCNSGASNHAGEWPLKRIRDAKGSFHLFLIPSNCFSLCCVEINHQH